MLHTPFWATDWHILPPEQACRHLYALCRKHGIDSPLPRRLRAYFETWADLSPQQIARHCRVALARLPAIRLAALQAEFWRCIDTPFNLRQHSAAARHAVRLLATLDINRKGLRRFLLQYAQGQPHAYQDHPLNMAWYRQHPRIDATPWRDGIVQQLQQDDGTRIQLAFEQEPLEILMLGTYAGSCLGLGGLCDYSAVACLLDANKQVVYARNDKGQVLARQLLAIDENDRLVCFGIYPDTADNLLKRAFAEFDSALAQTLGIDVLRDGEHYVIRLLLAEHWWDDSPWHGQVEK